MKDHWRATLCLILGLLATGLPALVWGVFATRSPYSGIGGNLTLYFLFPLCVLVALTCGIPAIVLGVKSGAADSGAASGRRRAGTGLSILGLLLAAAMLIVTGLHGCVERPAPPLPPPVTATDLRIAHECAALLEQTLHTLPNDHDIIRRYGRILSMSTDPVERHPTYGAGLGPGGSPPCLEMRCRCSFEKFPAQIDVTIFESKGGDGPAFFYPAGEFPGQFQMTAGVESDRKPQLINNELWYVREGGDQSRTRCFVRCWLKHPDFIP